jgi:hypothetical protein
MTSYGCTHMRAYPYRTRSIETIAANCAHVKAFQQLVKPSSIHVQRVQHVIDAEDVRVLRRDTCARSSTDTHGCNARKHVTDVFAVCNQTEQSLRLTA